MIQFIKHTLFNILTLVLLLTSCEQDDTCNGSTVAGVNFGLNTITDSEVTSLLITPYNAIDDTLYSSSSNDYILTLPLSVSEDSTEIAFITNNTTKDKIVFYHTLKLTFKDEACGYVPEFTIDSFKYSTLKIDTIIWVLDIVSTDIENENIEIYY